MWSLSNIAYSTKSKLIDAKIGNLILDAISVKIDVKQFGCINGLARWTMEVQSEYFLSTTPKYLIMSTA